MEILGIQIDPPYIKIALIRRTKRGSEIVKLNSYPLSTFSNVKRLYIKNFKGKVVSALPAKNLLIRSVELKIGKSRHIEEALAFQAESSSHLNPTDIITIPSIKKREKDATHALLFTVPRDLLKSHLSDLETFQIDPDRVSSSSSAICSFIRWKFPSLTDAFIMDFGSSEWNCIWMEEGVLKKSHSIPGGNEVLYKALLEDRKKILLPKEVEGAAKQLDLSKFKSHLYPHLAEKLHDFGQQAAKAIYSFQREGGAKPILFTGNPDSFIHLKETILESLEISAHNEQLSHEEQKHAVAIGLALEESSKNPLQFRVQEFFPIKNWSRLGKIALSLIAVSLFCTVSIFTAAKWALFKREKDLQMTLSRSLSTWDSSSKKEMSSQQWIAAIESHNKEYPYILQAPKVSEVFAWVSSHPLFATFSKEGDPICIQALHYQLEKFPQIGAMKEPYLAKIEMEFQVQSGIHARKFHEALLKGDDFVDPDQEITWEVLDQGYRTSFYLKNRRPDVF